MELQARSNMFVSLCCSWNPTRPCLADSSCRTELKLTTIIFSILRQEMEGQLSCRSWPSISWHQVIETAELYCCGRQLNGQELTQVTTTQSLAPDHCRYPSHYRQHFSTTAGCGGMLSILIHVNGTYHVYYAVWLQPTSDQLSFQVFL